MSAKVNDPVAYGSEDDDFEELKKEGEGNIVVYGAEPEFHVEEIIAKDNEVAVYAHRIAAEGEDKEEAMEKIKKAIKENRAQDGTLRKEPNLYFLSGEEAKTGPSPELEDKHFVDR